MNIHELWIARQQNRFTLKHYIWAWIISARLFALPWCGLYTCFGALLAGVSNPVSMLGSILTVVFVLLAAHFFNNYMDVVLGVDKVIDNLEEAERKVSSIKPYTAAAWLVPLKITSIEFQKTNAYIMLLLSAISYVFLVPVTPATLALYLLGVSIAILYTPFFKPKRLGEVACFLGHGFSTVAFGYLSQSPNILHALLASIPIGLISGLAYSVDQFMDIKTDFVERVGSIYESWFNSKMPLGLYVLLIVIFYFNMLIAWVAADIYPSGTLLTLAITPIILFRAPALEWDRERALRDIMFATVWMIPALMCLGVIIS